MISIKADFKSDQLKYPALPGIWLNIIEKRKTVVEDQRVVRSK
jgi:hypothetical protein